jgi:hypothetical protein
MPQRYREEYDGEFVIVENKISGGKKYQEREWIENPIDNQHISGRAVIIGNGLSRHNTNFNGKINLKTLIEQHSGWHLGRKRLQSYGTEGCWREMQCDFYVEYDPEKLAEITQAEYQKRVSVYSNARNCIANPGEFYLVPYGQRGKSVSVATWLACFDGHKEIFLVGVDGVDANNVYDGKLTHEMNIIMQEYSNINFIYVSDSSRPDDTWRKNVNFEIWNYWKFISYCDIGT